MNEIYEKNMNILKEKDRIAYSTIDNCPVIASKYEVIKTKTDQYTLEVKEGNGIYENKILLHSKYDPYSSECSFVNKNFDHDKTNIIVYGFGLGYHIELILDKLKSFQNLFVIDSNIEIVKIAFSIMDLSKIIKDGRLKFILLSEEYKYRTLSRLLDNDESMLMVHPSCSKVIPKQYESLKLLLKQMQMMKWGIEKNKDLLKANYIDNIRRELPNINQLFNKYSNFPIIIVSAGPSLNRNKHMLKKIKDKALIFCAGSALKPLIESGIYPDLICIIDPSPSTYKQIEGYEDISVPLIFLETASSYTISKYNGPKYIVSNTASTVGDENNIIETGGSVATAILDMSIKFGGNPIVFIGQDLAFTGYEHHADGSMYGEEEMIKDLPNLRKVRGINEEDLPTSSSLLSFKYWIERKISEHPNINFINATENGAAIEGCEHISLKDTINLYIKDEKNKDLELFLSELIYNSP